MAGEKKSEWQSGKRREIAEAEAIRYPNRWGPSHERRREQFKDWRYIAMQVLRREAISCGVIAVFDAVFLPETCDVLATDEELALEAGHCTVKTIQREIQALRRLGLISSERHWYLKGDKNVHGRRIRLSVPVNLDGIHIRGD